MTSLPSSTTRHLFERSEGISLLTAEDAIIKGLLEAEVATALLAGPRRGAFAGVFQAAGSSAAASALREHGVRVLAAPDATRSITLAGQVALSGRGAVVLIPNDRLDGATPELSRLASESLARGGSMVVILEDAPSACPASCPRRASRRLKVPSIEVADISRLRDAIESALLLSKVGRCVVGVIVHTSVLRSSDTIELRPNRIGRVVEVLHARRRRRVRIGLSGESTAAGAGMMGVMRAARRLELNGIRAVPSPGERVAMGFITVGPAEVALMHLVDVLQLHGRVPVLHLQLVNPVDEAVVTRLLARCERVLVLEPRPGTIEQQVLAIAEQMRRDDEEPAEVWGEAVPSNAQGESALIASDEDLHPSVLARKITHLLHAIRPSAQVATHLVSDPPPAPAVPTREEAIGIMAAISEIRRMLRDVDQWLRDRAPLKERGIAPSALAIDGAEPASSAAERLVVAEIWDHRRFLRGGAPAIVQAARDERPWMIIACESNGEDVGDLERLARGVIPADRTDRVTLDAGNFNDLVALRDLLREATLRDGLTVLIVRDGPPARYDVSAIDADAAEIDRLGFQPRQRLIDTADEMCSLRTTHAESTEQLFSTPGIALKTEVSYERVSERIAAKFRFRVRPMLEEVQVTRVRPPPLRWRTIGRSKLPTPQFMHASSPRWRVHLAGVRGQAPGAVAIVLQQAARAMSYHVRCAHDPQSIGPGRKAWTQLLFTRPHSYDQAIHLAAIIPFGEADLLLGFDPRETIRAISPLHQLRVATFGETCAVVNVAPFMDDEDIDSPAVAPDAVSGSVAAVSSPNRCATADFASACRAWFHTDRLADMAMLGLAYQRGFVPVSAEAIESGLSAAESRGFGRAMEAFEFGRRLAIDDTLFTQRDEDAAMPVERVARRIALSMRRGPPGSSSRARRLAAVLESSLEQMPGLSETDAGRQGCRDFVLGFHHCMIWGGLDYAETFADLLTRLYQVDRGDTGRALTRSAILPLAETMLIRDPLYVAGLAASAERRRSVRERLHAKRSRGDEIERRYLTRIDLLAFGRRARIDVRTSDWPARIASAMRRFVPARFRGTRRERQLRDFMLQFLRRAIVESPSDYDRWAASIARLHDQAVDDRLRGMALAEVRMLVGIDEHEIEQ